MTQGRKQTRLRCGQTVLGRKTEESNRHSQELQLFLYLTEIFPLYPPRLHCRK